MTVTTEEMKKIEDWSSKNGFTTTLMMENAGRAVAEVVLERFDPRTTGKVCVVCGKGNNGGDALAAARHLLLSGYNVEAYLIGGSVKGGDAELMLKLYELLKKVHTEIPGINELKGCEVIIDGIFGTGIKGEVKEPFASVIQMINQSQAFVVSVDVPSGLDPDTGVAANATVQADVTVTLHDAKPGLLNSRYVGKLVIKEIGIPLLPGKKP
ncbi:MAG: NAD(P)H-hydrate epimerase [Nitrososphaeria archaeon]|nr:NAD(P)H-hydrate epimerase [Conexivisphaerales archaeon]